MSRRHAADLARRGPSGDDGPGRRGARAAERLLLVDTDPPRSRPSSTGVLAEVRPAESKPRAALGRLEVGGRRDRAEPRNREAPADMVVRLPVDDLLERGEPAGHALGGRSDAAPPAWRGLLDDERPFPRRSEARGEVRWAQTTDGSAATIASRSRTTSACLRTRGGGRRSRPASAPRGRA